jgi:hypothetical protein
MTEPTTIDYSHCQRCGRPETPFPHSTSSPVELQDDDMIVLTKWRNGDNWLPDPNREQIHEDIIQCAQCGKYEKKDLAAHITATVIPSTLAAWFNVCSRCAKYYKEEEVVCNCCLGGLCWWNKTMK